MSDTDLAEISEAPRRGTFAPRRTHLGKPRADPSGVPLGDAHRAVIDERLAEHERNPDDVVSRTTYSRRPAVADDPASRLPPQGRAGPGWGIWMVRRTTRRPREEFLAAVDTPSMPSNGFRKCSAAYTAKYGVPTCRDFHTRLLSHRSNTVLVLTITPHGTKSDALAAAKEQRPLTTASIPTASRRIMRDVSRHKGP